MFNLSTKFNAREINELLDNVIAQMSTYVIKDNEDATEFSKLAMRLDWQPERVITPEVAVELPFEDLLEVKLDQLTKFDNFQQVILANIETKNAQFLFRAADLDPALLFACVNSKSSDEFCTYFMECMQRAGQVNVSVADFQNLVSHRGLLVQVCKNVDPDMSSANDNMFELKFNM